MLRLRKMERIVEPDYAMDRHKTMTPETMTLIRMGRLGPVPTAGPICSRGTAGCC